MAHARTCSSRSMRAVLTLGWLAALIISTSPALPQTRASLTGTVTDKSGGVVSQAKVELTNTATGLLYSTETHESGIYVFPTLTPGEYQLTCEVPGFKKIVRTGLTLETGFIRTVDIELQVGKITETESSTFGQLIEREMVENMPLEACRTARALRRGEAVDEFSGLMSVGGGRSPVGGIVLIVVGVLFLLNSLGFWQLRQLSRYWPVILIAAGVYMIYRRITENREDSGPRSADPRH